MPEACVDMIITSPPYADQIKDYGEKVEKITPDQYLDWFLPRAEEMYRVLSDKGSFVLNISDKVDGTFQSLYVYKLVVALCEEIGFNLVRDYIWFNPATPPNVFSRGKLGRTKKSHEYCFWFSKSSDWYFDMDSIRKPYSKDMERYLKGKGKGDRSENTRPSRHNFKLDKEWADHGGADPGSVIVLGNTSSNDKFHKLCKEAKISHPARFPQKLVEFFMLAGTKESETVLDPFAGSGTTAVVAKQLNRKYICIEINPQFCDLATQWLQAIDEVGPKGGKK